MDYQITTHRMMIKRDIQQVLQSYSNRCAKLKPPNQLGTYSAYLIRLVDFPSQTCDVSFDHLSSYLIQIDIFCRKK